MAYCAVWNGCAHKLYAEVGLHRMKPVKAVIDNFV